MSPPSLEMRPQHYRTEREVNGAGVRLTAVFSLAGPPHQNYEGELCRTLARIRQLELRPAEKDFDFLTP